MIITTRKTDSEKLCRGEYHGIGLSAVDTVENGKHFVIRNIKARNITPVSVRKQVLITPRSLFTVVTIRD